MSEKKVKWGVLGTANIAWNETLPGMMQAQNAQLYAIAGRSAEKVAKFKAEFGFEKGYLSYEELLADPQVEAVYIPLPNHLHKEWTLKAAAAKKHVLCEKPLAPTGADAREMFAACRKVGVVLSEAFAYLHSPVIRQILQAVHGGAVGTPLYVESTFLLPPFSAEDIRMRRETLGGGSYDLGCYNLSLILALMQSRPAAVKAMADYTSAGIDDFSCTYLRFANGARASGICGMCSGQRADRFFVYGTGGTLQAPIPFNATGETHYTIQNASGTNHFSLQVESNYKLEAEQFGRCLLEGEEPLVSEAFSVQLADVMTEALESMGYFSH